MNRMAGRQLFIEQAGSRRPFTPGAQLGRGGEATVFEVAGEPGLAAKLWQQPSQAQQAKLSVMLRAVPADPAGDGHVSLAWPLYALVDRSGSAAGFVMWARSGSHARAW